MLGWHKAQGAEIKKIVIAILLIYIVISIMLARAIRVSSGLPSASFAGLSSVVFVSADPVVRKIHSEFRTEFGAIEDTPAINNMDEFWTGYNYSPIKIDSVEAIIPKIYKKFPLELCMIWQRKLGMVLFMGLSAIEANACNQSYSKIDVRILGENSMTGINATFASRAIKDGVASINTVARPSYLAQAKLTKLLAHTTTLPSLWTTKHALD